MIRRTSLLFSLLAISACASNASLKQKLTKDRPLNIYAKLEIRK